ncbi:MAG: two-component sensor histidine kinase, partial [Duncaniella sp.]|nr:two-component sensor histidine kinase [Duncaniella sp.]
IDGVRPRVSPGVTLKFDESSPSISLFTDPQRLHQILLNLLTNAAKFTSEGSITLAYTVDPDKEKVIFSVTDTGIGIKADKHETIFGRFVKLDKETQGAGLGLTISRMLARLMGGDIVVDSHYNKGARFILTLPQK